MCKNGTSEKLVKMAHFLKITLRELFKEFFQLIYEIKSAYLLIFDKMKNSILYTAVHDTTLIWQDIRKTHFGFSTSLCIFKFLKTLH